VSLRSAILGCDTTCRVSAMRQDASKAVATGRKAIQHQAKMFASAMFVTLLLGAQSTPLEDALEYVISLEGTKYGWWTGGVIPAGPPAWAENSAAPSKAVVMGSSCFCAGIPNLMLRVVGGIIPCLHLAKPDPQCGQCCGGTGAYGKNFTSVAEHFNINKKYSRGTLLGRPYSSVHDQGHVAVLLGEGKDGKLLQSYVQPGPDCPSEPCKKVIPGVSANLTLEEAYQSLSFCNFTYAIAPEDWLVGA